MPEQPPDEEDFICEGVIFTKRDELAFSRVLRELCPAAVITQDHGDEAVQSPLAVPNIPHAPLQCVAITLPPANCRFEYVRSAFLLADPDKDWAIGKPELFVLADFTVWFPPSDREAELFARQVIGLLQKVTYRHEAKNPEGLHLFTESESVWHGLGTAQRSDLHEDIRRNKYYDDSLWDDRMPDFADDEMA